ncbi:MAG: hypothetical protein WDM77_02445 [Steroidobacteraceae bacterium]
MAAMGMAASAAQPSFESRQPLPQLLNRAATSEPLEEVVVSATREQLVPRVSKFVARIVVRENEEGLPRWAGAGLSAGHRSVPKGG